LTALAAPAAPQPPIAARATPNPPKQERARARVDQALDAAEQLLSAQAAGALSLPTIALAAGMPASSLYHFFPSAEAVLVALVRRYNARLDALIEQAWPALPKQRWQDLVRGVMALGRDFHDRHPTYARLVLRTAAFDGLRRADDAHIVEMARRLLVLLQAHFLVPPTPRLDEKLAVAIAISDRIWALAPPQSGKISDSMFEESQHAVLAYLSCYLPPLMARREETVR
jgi:AcrR family transcriptional regulator